MKPKIIILLGEEKSGKSSTIRNLFKRRANKYLHFLILKNKVVYIYGHGSPQESSKFCIVKDVMRKIDNRIKWCKRYHERSHYKSKKMEVLIPFTIQKRKGKINIKCILLPLKYLRRKYNVKVIYLEKRNEALDKLVKVTKPSKKITSYEGEQRRQSRELWRLL